MGPEGPEMSIGMPPFGKLRGPSAPPPNPNAAPNGGITRIMGPVRLAANCAPEAGGRSTPARGEPSEEAPAAGIQVTIGVDDTGGGTFGGRYMAPADWPNTGRGIACGISDCCEEAELFVMPPRKRTGRVFTEPSSCRRRIDTHCGGITQPIHIWM